MELPSRYFKTPTKNLPRNLLVVSLDSVLLRTRYSTNLRRFSIAVQVILD